MKGGRFRSPVDHPALLDQAIDVEDDVYSAMSDSVRRARGICGPPADHPAPQDQAIDVGDDVYVAMTDFGCRTKLRVHPFGQPTKLPPVVAQSLIVTTTSGPSAVTQGRRDVPD